MRVRCDYCGNYIEDTDKNCPHCGAPNDRMQRSGTKVPKTIEELKAFCAAHHLPLEQMRFFLGEDYRGPRAFGVYKDGEGNFVVYKNKSDGSRAIRYRGTDEAYAVNELYQKMKSEISNQRARQIGAVRAGHEALERIQADLPGTADDIDDGKDRKQDHEETGKLSLFLQPSVFVSFVLRSISAVLIQLLLSRSCSRSPSQGARCCSCASIRRTRPAPSSRP